MCRREYELNKEHYRKLGLSQQEFINSRLINDGHETLPMAGETCLPHEEEMQSLKWEETAEKIRTFCNNLGLDYLADSAIEMNQTLSEAKIKIRQVTRRFGTKPVRM